MLGIWRKPPPPPPKPWYKKVWNEWKQLYISIGSILAFVGGLYSYIALDTTKFIKTTEVVVAADATNVYSQIDVVSEIREVAYLNIYIDGQLVESMTLPKGIKEGEFIITTPIPFTSPGRHLSVDIEITFLGIRTLFLPQTIESNHDVEKHYEQSNNSNSRGSSGYYKRPSEFWI